jgi:hypothetical protein
MGYYHPRRRISKNIEPAGTESADKNRDWEEQRQQQELFVFGA